VARAKEFAFLLYVVLLAVVYAVAHDQVTATISPEYFVYGKGLTLSSLRWEVAWLAVRAGLPVGLLGGTALLVANNPRRARVPPQLGYRTLMGLALAPIVGAAFLAGGLGAANASAQLGTATARALGVPNARVWRFVIVWGVHVGSYVGALFGIVCVALVARRRKGRCRPEAVDPIDRNGRCRGVLRGLAWVLVAYGSLCLIARLRYRVLLYPAPPVTKAGNGYMRQLLVQSASSILRVGDPDDPLRLGEPRSFRHWRPVLTRHGLAGVSSPTQRSLTPVSLVPRAAPRPPRRTAARASQVPGRRRKAWTRARIP